MEPRSLKHMARMVYAHYLLDIFSALKRRNDNLDSAAFPESEDMLTYMLDRNVERMCAELVLCLAPAYLRQLALKPSQGLSTHDVIRILDKCCHLSGLSLEDCEDLDVGQVVTLARPQFTSLVTLNVAGCQDMTDKHVQDLLRTCVHLHHLTLDNTAITDSAFLLLPGRQNHLELTGQKRSGSDGGWQCRLSHVSVSSCVKFTNTGLLHLASLTGPSLRSLLAQDTQVDFYGLLYLSGHSKLSAKHFLHTLLHATTTTIATTTTTTMADSITTATTTTSADGTTTTTVTTATTTTTTSSSLQPRSVDRCRVTCEDGEERSGSSQVTVHHDDNWEGRVPEDLTQCGQVSCQKRPVGDWCSEVAVPCQNEHTYCTVSQQNTVAQSSMSQENTVTQSSMSQQNFVTQSSMSQQNTATRSSVSQQNTVTPSSMSQQNTVTQSSMSQQNTVTPTSMSQQNTVTQSSMSQENTATPFSMSQRNIVTQSSMSQQNSVRQSSSTSQQIFVTQSSMAPENKNSVPQSAWGGCSPLANHDSLHLHPSCQGATVDPQQILLTVADLDPFSVTHIKHQSSQMSGHKDSERSDHKDSENSDYKDSQGSDYIERLDPHKDSTGSVFRTSKGDGDCSHSGDEASSPRDQASLPDIASSLLDEASPLPNSLPRDLPSVLVSSLQREEEEGVSGTTSTAPSSSSSSFSSPALMFRSDLKRVSFSSNLGQMEAGGHQQFPVQCFCLFLSANPRLEHLHLQCTVKESDESTLFYEYCQELFQLVLEVIGKYASHLEHLAITQEDTGVSYLDDTSVSRLLSRCTRLRSLDMSGDRDLSDKAFDGLQNSLNLEHLSLSPSPVTLTTPFFTPPPHPSQLTTLDLTWCEEVKEGQLNQALILCPCLTTLKLRLCEVTNDTLRVIGQHCTAVRQLDIAGAKDLQDEAVVCLAHALRDLTVLDLSNNCGLGNDTVQALLSFCPHLETLTLSCLPLVTSMPFLPMVTGEGWKEWIADQVTPNPVTFLKPLYLSEDMQHQLSQGWSDLCRSSNYGGSLTHVDLSYCNSIDDRSMRAVVTVCRGGLQVINYYKERVTPHNHLL